MKGSWQLLEAKKGGKPKYLIYIITEIISRAWGVWLGSFGSVHHSLLFWSSSVSNPQSPEIPPVSSESTAFLSPPLVPAASSQPAKHPLGDFCGSFSRCGGKTGLKANHLCLSSQWCWDYIPAAEHLELNSCSTPSG